MMEEWRPVAGFPLYQVSDLGRVRRHPDHLHWNSPAVLAGVLTRGGYQCVRLMRDKKPHWLRVHILVCIAFNGPRPSPKHEVGFRNDRPADTRAANVFWRTRIEERQHRKITGTHREGERVSWAKLRASQIPAIRKRLASHESMLSIAADYGVSEGAINGIRIGRNWKHVP